MAVTELETERPPGPKFVDREWLIRKFEELHKNGTLDYEIDPSITPEMSRKIIEDGMRSRGIDPDTIRYQQHPDDANGLQP